MTWPAKFGEWVSPAEGYPHQASNVILFLKSGEVAGGWYAKYGESHHFFDSKVGGYPFKLESVLAWMPMPKGPTEV